MIKLIVEREQRNKDTDALAITISMCGSGYDLMEELEHLLSEFYRTVYRQNGKLVLDKVIMATRDAIQDAMDMVPVNGR